MVPVPGSPGPGPDCGDSASESREASGGSLLSSSASFSRWLASPEAGGWPLRLAGWGGSPLRLAGWGGMAASAWLEAGLARVLFYPTLLYTVFRGRVRGPAHRDWYHRIDHTVLLGALPLRSMTRRVREAAGPGRAGSGPRASAGAPRPSLSPLFASAAGTGRERARSDHYERGVRDQIPVQHLEGEDSGPGKLEKLGDGGTLWVTLPRSTVSARQALMAAGGKTLKLISQKEALESGARAGDSGGRGRIF